MVAVKSFNLVTIRRANMFEMTVFERMRNYITLVVRLVMAIPMIIVHVRHRINACIVPFDFRLRVNVAFGRWTLWNMSLVSTRIFVMLFWTLRVQRNGNAERQDCGNCETNLHQITPPVERRQPGACVA